MTPNHTLVGGVRGPQMGCSDPLEVKKSIFPASENDLGSIWESRFFDHFRPGVTPTTLENALFGADFGCKFVILGSKWAYHAYSGAGNMFYLLRELFSPDLWPYRPVLLKLEPKHCILASIWALAR